MTKDCLGRAHFMIQSEGNSASSRDPRCMALQVLTRNIPQGNIILFHSIREIFQGAILDQIFFPKWPVVCMKVAEAESDKDCGGLTIGGITGAVTLTIVIICIPTQELSPKTHSVSIGRNMGRAC